MCEFILLASLENLRGYALPVGIVGVITGMLLLAAHKRSFNNTVAGQTDSRVRRFEARKFRRRAAVASMVAAAGCLTAALHWVVEVKIFAAFILLIMSLLVGILGIALMDMFSVSLQALTRTDKAEQKKIVEEYLRKRDKTATEEVDNNV